MTRRIGMLFAGTALVALSACSTPADNTAATTAEATGTAAGVLSDANIGLIKTAIADFNKKGAEALMAGDVNAFLGNYVDSAITMMPNMPRMAGRAAIESGFKDMLESMKISAVSFSTDNVMIGGDLAIETGSYTMTLTPKGGKAMPDNGKYLTVWQHQADGSWKIIRDISNSDLAIPTDANHK